MNLLKLKAPGEGIALKLNEPGVGVGKLGLADV